MPSHVSENTELGLVPRLIAATWFGVTACIPTFFFFLQYGARDNPDFGVLWNFGVLPVLVAAFFGFTLDSRILDPVKSMTEWRAALGGMSIAVLSYVVFICWFSLNVALSTHPSDPNFFLLAIVVMIIGSKPLVVATVPVSGVLAGWLLCRLSCQAEFWEWLLNIPRINLTRANVLIALAAFFVTLNGAIALLLLKLI